MTTTTEDERDDSNDYIKSVDFFNEQMRVLTTGTITNELGEMFMLLASRYVNHPNFCRYAHLRDDMIAAGVLGCTRDCFKFRPNRNIIKRDENDEIIESVPVLWDGKQIDYHHTLHYNPLAFYTTCIRREFLDVIKKAYLQRNIVNQLLIDGGFEADEGYLDAMRTKEMREKEENANSALELAQKDDSMAAVIF